VTCIAIFAKHPYELDWKIPLKVWASPDFLDVDGMLFLLEIRFTALFLGYDL